MRNDKDNLIVTKTIQFSLQIIIFCEILDNHRKYIISKQLLRSGTSIGANIWEAQNAKSRADFIHKMKISAKECDETKYWLKICLLAESYPNCQELWDEATQIEKILSKIISSSKINLKN